MVARRPSDSVEIRDPSEQLVPGGANGASDQYSALVCSIFMLNMVLGTGPITLPYAFNQAGIILSMFFLTFLMSLSFITTTFFVESLSTAGRLRQAGLTDRGAGGDHLSGEDRRPILERLEIGAIGEAVLPKSLHKLPYLIVCGYAYGVLTAYVISGVKSLSSEIGFVNGIDSYYIVLVCFVVLITPICLLDFQKTRPLQIFIGAVRILAVLSMMFFMLRLMFDNGFEKMASEPIPLVQVSGMPDLFGNAAFTFMIHHSLPGLVFPLQDQRRAKYAIGAAYFVSWLIYIMLCLLALLAFGHQKITECANVPSDPCTIQKLFNLNFSSLNEMWGAKFIVCYPVLVVSVFPLVAITLRNNLKALCGVSARRQQEGFDFVNLGFTILTCGPPFTVGIFLRDIQIVMTYVGGYFGLTLMFCVPSLMVMYARRSGQPSPLPSPFRHRCVLYLVGLVFVGAVVFNTVSLSMNPP